MQHLTSVSGGIALILHIATTTRDAPKKKLTSAQIRLVSDIPTPVAHFDHDVHEF